MPAHLNIVPDTLPSSQFGPGEELNLAAVYAGGHPIAVEFDLVHPSRAGHKIRASRFLQKLVREKTSLFVHWRIGMTGTFA